jgi:hypothetical protein
MFFYCRNITNNASQIFVPILHNEEYRMELPAVFVIGNNRFRVFRMALWRIDAIYFVIIN